jgi:hypothetical protein
MDNAANICLYCALAALILGGIARWIASVAIRRTSGAKDRVGVNGNFPPILMVPWFVAMLTFAAIRTQTSPVVHNIAVIAALLNLALAWYLFVRVMGERQRQKADERAKADQPGEDR